MLMEEIIGVLQPGTLDERGNEFTAKLHNELVRARFIGQEGKAGLCLVGRDRIGA